MVDSKSEWPERQDLRSWLRVLARRGDLRRVRRTVDPRFEIAAILSQLDGTAAVIFDDVAGSSFPLVGNTVCHRDHMALALDCEVARLAETYDRAAAAPRACVEVSTDQAPVMARRLEAEAGLDLLPIPVHHERDAGRYLSSGVVVARDPASGAINLSINRLQVSGSRTLRALILPGRLRTILDAAEERGEPLDVAICLGVDPLLVLASQVRPMRAVDELEVCSALRRSPLPVTRAPNLDDLVVPATPELLIEGRIRPGEREMEGPFGEYPRTYGPAGPGPVIDVVAVWHREQPISQTILSAGREHLLAGAIPREADLLRRLRELDASVRQVRLTEGGSCRMHAVVALERPRPGRARNAALAALAANPVLKRVVTVDADVDIFSDEEVEWALATRLQADRDVAIVSGAGGGSLDPSARDGTTAKMIVDATVPPGEGERYARMRVPGAEDVDLSIAERIGDGPAG